MHIFLYHPKFESLCTVTNVFYASGLNSLNGTCPVISTTFTERLKLSAVKGLNFVLY